MRILVIDNTIDRDSWGSADLVSAIRPFAQGACIEVRRAPALDLPRSHMDYSHIVISGSKTRIDEEAPWIVEHDRFVKQAIEAGIAVLGVCYGHQALARVLGGKAIVGASKTPEIGWAEISCKKDDPLFKGLPEKFYSAVRHFDEVYELPPETECIASSARCSIQAFRMSYRKVYGIQFHPERTPEGMDRTFEKFRKSKDRQYFLGEGDTRKRYRSDVAAKIFSNFLSANEDHP